MDGNVLREIEDYKLPALRQAGYSIDPNPQILLFSRGGHNATVQKAAANNEYLHLLGISEIA